MKKLTIYFLGMAFLLSSAVISHGQAEEKLGHINTNQLIFSMPQRKAAQKVLQEYAKTLDQQLKEMTGELKTKVEEYQAKESDWLEEIKNAKTVEIREIENRIREFQRTAQEAVQKKENESMQPIAQSVRDAIREVATREGYTYVFDSGAGSLLVAPQSDDLFDLVKEALGLDDELLQDTSKEPAAEEESGDSTSQEN